jgi:hypothetical protein
LNFRFTEFSEIRQEFIANSSLFARVAALVNKTGLVSPTLMERRFLALTIGKWSEDLLWEGEKVEKVDGALGVVGSDDACGFSGLGLAAWT